MCFRLWWSDSSKQLHDMQILDLLGANGFDHLLKGCAPGNTQHIALGYNTLQIVGRFRTHLTFQKGTIFSI
jgi:hypothetical protein